MAILRQDKPLIRRDLLTVIGDARLAEGRSLAEAGHSTAAIYLAGYAVECYLKWAICRTLDWEHLLTTFKIHNLDFLLTHSGLKRRMRSAGAVQDSFKNVVGMWSIESNESVRYRHPNTWGLEEARRFLTWVEDERIGVVPWVKRQF